MNEMLRTSSRLLRQTTSRTACAFLLCLVTPLSSAGDSPWKIEVRTDRVVYLPGSPGSADITMTAADDDWPEDLTLKSSLEYGLHERRFLPDISIARSAGCTVSMPFPPPAEAWGCTLQVRLVRGDEELASGQDVFAVGTDHYRLGQDASCWSQDLSAERVGDFSGAESVWPARWHSEKGTWLEIFCNGPGEFCGLKTDWEQWISMQGKYKRSKAGIRGFIGAAHTLGMKVMMYNNATPSGWLGTEWARKHPEWLSYKYMGDMRGTPSVRDIEKMKTWHQTMEPDKIRGFQPFQINLAVPELVDFGCDQMLAACEDLGFDGVRFDGHWVLGQFWTGLGYDIEGRRPNREKSLDAVNARITRQMKKYVLERMPNFEFGYNYGLNYEYGGGKGPDAYREACAGNGMILWEGSTFGDGPFSEWRNGAAELRENALRIHQGGGVHYGHLRLVHASEQYPVNDFSLRYFLITNFAAASHIYGSVFPGHPSYRPILGRYYRFALRYGELLYDEDLRPVLNPGDHLSITVNGEETADLWWEIYTFKRPLKGRYQIITHLVNMPAPGITKPISTADKQPAPLENVLVTLTETPERVFLLDPEDEEWIRELGTESPVAIPQVNAWKILVQEFSGSCDDIPVEIIPEKSFHGEDLAPNPRDGRVDFPILLFARGELGTRLVEDEEARFGHALHCDADAMVGETRVMDGPRKETPTAAPGRARVTFRLKVADNTSAERVCTFTGRFGEMDIAGNAFAEPRVYQDFAFEYDLAGGDYDVVSIDFYPDGETDLWVDSLMMEQISIGTDRDQFEEKDLETTTLPSRKCRTNKALLVRGLWHDFFGFDDALRRAGMSWTDAWETLSDHRGMIPENLPDSTGLWMEYDLVTLLNVSADSLGLNGRKNLREFVVRGGTLFVGGGTRAFGHGGYENTFLEEIIPADVGRFDLMKAVGDAQLVGPGIENELTRGISFAAEPRNLFYHDIQVKPGAGVLLTAGDAPILTVWKVGQGTVYAMTGTPLGEAEKTVPWWQWDEWQTILDRLVEQAGR